MKFLNLDLSATFNAPEFTGSEPANRSTWFCLMCYCAIQENGGRILKCQAWGERRWPQEAKVFKAEVETQSDLWFWEDGDLVVRLYPIEQESQFRTMREGGRLGGIKSGVSRAKEGPLKAPLKAPLERKGIVREGNVIPEGKVITVRDYSTIHDPKYDPVDLASSVTGDFTDQGRGGWKKDLAVVGDERFRKALETVFGEIKSGEKADNWAAVFTGRLKKIRIKLAAPQGSQKSITN